MATLTLPPNLWEQLTPEQQARILAVLVQMLLSRLAPSEVADEPQ
jgi:hypothetical protein